MTTPDIIERLADLIQADMGPLVGSPEYLADPVKLARAKRRQREAAVHYATLAEQAHAAELTRLREENGRLREALGRTTGLLSEYLNKTPLGHQPHMIAHRAEAAIAEALSLFGRAG